MTINELDGPDLGGKKNGAKAPTTKELAVRADATDDRLSSLETAVSELGDSVKESTAANSDRFDQMMEALKGMTAKDRGASREFNGPIAQDYDQRPDGQVRGFADVDPNEDARMIEVERRPVDSGAFKSKADNLAFAAQMVKVLVMNSSQEYPDATFTISVNGDERLVVRGMPQWLPRAHVEVMAMAKTSSYGNVEKINAVGEREIDNPETRVSRYIFQVLEDPAGASSHQEWMEGLMNQANM